MTTSILPYPFKALVTAAMVLCLFWAIPIIDARASGDSEQIFIDKCSMCHSVGGGDSMGPDLEGLFDRRDTDWIRSYITDPDGMKSSGDPEAIELGENWSMAMPVLDLTGEDISAIMEYLGGDTPDGSATSTEIPDGDPVAGEALFNGSMRFSNGGQACINCHSAGGQGGSLGPGLAGLIENSSESGVYALLGTLPFPTMKPIYDDRPLTEDEKSDLTAFFAGQGSGSTEPGSGGIIIFGLIGLGILMGLSSIIWKDRNPGVRKNLIAVSTGDKGDSK